MMAIEGLQWGHDLVVMESFYKLHGCGLDIWLQWGHDLVVMESGCRCSTVHTSPCFNGAMTSWSWRAQPAAGPELRSDASMGP